MIDGLLRYHQALGDLRVAQSLRHEREHLEFPRGQARWVLACPRARPTRNPPDATLAQPAGDDRGDRSSPERLQMLESLLNRGLVVCVGERERGLIWASDLAPARSRPRPIAGDRQPVRLRD